MKTFNQIKLKRAGLSARSVAKKMTALSNATHIFTEDEVKEKSFEGKDMDLFLTAIDSSPIDESNDLRMWAATTDLKALRESFGLSQRELANKLNTSQPTICAIENHKSSYGVSVALLEKLHDFYEHPINKQSVATQDNTPVTTVPAYVKTLRSLLKKADMTYVDAARGANIPKSTVYSIVKGEVKKESKNARALKAFLKDYINNPQPQPQDQPQDAHFMEVRDFCLNHLEEALEGYNRQEVADELGFHVSFFSKCIRSFDEKFHHLTPSLEKMYNYFTAPCVEVPVPQLQEQPTPVVETPVVAQLINYTADEVALLTSILDEKIESLKDTLAIFLDNEQYEYAKIVIDKIEAVKALLPSNK